MKILSKQSINYEKPKSKLSLSIISVVIVLLAIYFLFAYLLSFWPFKAPDPAELFTESFHNLFKINSASYEIKFALESQDKKEESKKLSSVLSEYTKDLQPMYDRDNDRLRDIKMIKDGLRNFFKKKGIYPSEMSVAGITQKNDPLGNPYKYEVKNGQKDFIFEVEFETDESIETILQSGYSYNSNKPEIEDKKVIFNKDSLYYFYVYSENIKPKLPSFLNLISKLNELILFLPSDLDLKLNINGLTHSKKESIPDTNLSVEASAKFSDMSYEAGAELLKKEKIVYFKLNQFPSLFFGSKIDKIKQKWVKLTPDDVSGYYTHSVDDLVEKEAELKKQVLEQLQNLFSLALDHRVILGFDKAEEEVINGTSYYKYALSLDKGRIKSFYKTLTENFKNQFGEKSFIKFDQTTYEYLEGPAFDELYDYLNNNIKFYYYANPRTKNPFTFKYEICLIPDAEATDYTGIYLSFNNDSNLEKEFIFTLNVYLKDIDKKIQINEPEEFITFMNFQLLLTGQTEEEYLMKKQISNISAIRKALSYYYLFSGVYPDSLDSLKKTYKEIEIIKTPELRDDKEARIYDNIKYYQEKFEDTPLMKNIPVDAYGETYIYQKIEDDPNLTWGEDYNISFNLYLPSYEKGKRPLRSIYKNYGSFNKKINKYENFFELIYKNGLNYQSAFSDENKKPINSIDTDNDGIADNFEHYLGTNPNEKDSDQDGVIDGDELKLYSNPLGPGKLEY